MRKISFLTLLLIESFFFFFLFSHTGVAQTSNCTISVDRPGGLYRTGEKITITADTSKLSPIWFFYVENLDTKKKKEDGSCRVGCPPGVKKTYDTNALISELGGKGSYRAYLPQCHSAGCAFGRYVRCEVGFCIAGVGEECVSPSLLGEGKCDPCGWCDQNNDGRLDLNDKRPDHWNKCNKCIIGETLKTDGTLVPGVWTALGCISTHPAGFVSWLLQKVIGIAGGIAFLLILYGGFQILTSTGDPEKLASGKDIIVGALAGLLMIIFSVLLLRIIGYDILQIPGFITK